MAKKLRWLNGRLQYSDDVGLRGWKDYTQHPLKVLDYNTPQGSKGFSTAQALLRLNYSFVKNSVDDFS